MEIQCHCGKIIETDWKEVIDLDSSVEQEILEGTFLTIDCPDCNEKLKPEIKIILKNDKTALLWLPDISRLSFMTDQVKVDPSVTDVAIGFKELQEAIKLYQSNLNKSVIEVIKYQIYKKVEDDKDVTVYFHDLMDDQYIFHIEGVKADEIGVLKVPQTMYDKIGKDLPDLVEKYPYSVILKKPYISVNNLIMGDSE
ncbi:CpXC domain-containing protein [Spirochaeta cellobiosiphila]|uniref:CpXC domain-containing protein n=1 Tax=Spirochaeta cellobiosiphila TaxID=504483 RepID=UPI0004185F84|nr:CpXC domain-containing protein [Spirochaeta cellobiosiphila]